MHAQSAFRTYICSNLNLCTLPMSLSIPRTKKEILRQYFQCVTDSKKKKTKKEAAAANTKKKKEAKFAGHHQIPILFASTFIIVMIFISSSHHQSLKSQVLLQNKKKKTSKISYYRHNYQQTLVTPALLRPSAEVLPHLPVAARRITVRLGGAAACMRKTTCELCKGGTIWLTMHRSPRGSGRCKILGMLMNFPCGTFLWSRQKYWGW